MFDPTIFPIAILLLPLIFAKTLTTISGRLVPRAIIVPPIINFGILNLLEIIIELAINNSEL